jgi:hypothetical protein
MKRTSGSTVPSMLISGDHTLLVPLSSTPSTPVTHAPSPPGLASPSGVRGLIVQLSLTSWRTIGPRAVSSMPSTFTAKPSSPWLNVAFMISL